MVREPKWMVVAVGIPRRQTEDHKVRNQHQKHLSLRENARCRSQTEGRDHGIDGIEAAVSLNIQKHGYTEWHSGGTCCLSEAIPKISNET